MKKEIDWNKIKNCLWELENCVGKPHTDYAMEKRIADGLFEILKLPIWKFLTIKKWEWKYAKAINKHKDCCGLVY